MTMIGMPARPPENPRFALVDHDGRAVTQASYAGQWTLVFFGFTHCERICPVELAKLSDALDRAGQVAERFSPLYITVDPERDDPARLREFLRAYPRFTGLTGSRPELERARMDFRVFVRRTEDASAVGGYRVPHTASAFLVDPVGAFVAHFPDQLSADEISRRLRELAGD